MNRPHCPSSLKPPVIESGGSSTKATPSFPVGLCGSLCCLQRFLTVFQISSHTTDHSSGSPASPGGHFSMAPHGHQREMGLLCRAIRAFHCSHLSKPIISPHLGLASAKPNVCPYCLCPDEYSSCFRTLSQASRLRTQQMLPVFPASVQGWHLGGVLPSCSMSVWESVRQERSLCQGCLWEGDWLSSWVLAWPGGCLHIRVLLHLLQAKAELSFWAGVGGAVTCSGWLLV